jgi:hypothetical protein
LLKIGGKNGIVAVVITLGWWGAVLDTIARDKLEWNAALGDEIFAFCGCLM